MLQLLSNWNLAAQLCLVPRYFLRFKAKSNICTEVLKMLDPYWSIRKGAFLNTSHWGIP